MEYSRIKIITPEMKSELEETLTDLGTIITEEALKRMKEHDSPVEIQIEVSRRLNGKLYVDPISINIEQEGNFGFPIKEGERYSEERKKIVKALCAMYRKETRTEISEDSFLLYSSIVTLEL